MAKLLKIGAAVTARVGKVIGSRAAAARYGKRIVRPSVSLELSELPTVLRSVAKMFFFFPYLEQAYRVFISFTRNG